MVGPLPQDFKEHTVEEQPGRRDRIRSYFQGSRRQVYIELALAGLLLLALGAGLLWVNLAG